MIGVPARYRRAAAASGTAAPARTNRSSKIRRKYQMVPSRIISADSHMLEPPDLWTTRLDKKYRDQAPHVEDNERGSYFIAPGLKPSRVSLGFVAGRSGQELQEHFNKGFETAPAGGWDPVARIKDQDVDGVIAEILYTTYGMPLFS